MSRKNEPYSELESSSGNPDATKEIEMRSASEIPPAPLDKQASSRGFPAKFHLSDDLPDGKIVLGADENVIESWSFESTSLSFLEWIVTYLSLGLYYYVTRIFIQRKRYYQVYVTNLNIIVREEMSECNWGCLKILTENQASYPISSLAFLAAEVMGKKAFGLFPPSVALEMRFGRYPLASEYPETAYRSFLAVFMEQFSMATTVAYKKVFGVDYDAAPMVVATQLRKAAPKMQVPYMWALFLAEVALVLLQTAANDVYLVLSALLLDPAVGPRQAAGLRDACVFRLDADVSQDPDCREHLRRIVTAVTTLLPDRGIVDNSVKSRLRSALITVPIGEVPQPINAKKAYGEGDEAFVVLQDYLYIPDEEVVYDVCAVNPYWTFSDIKRVLFSCGLYYFTDLAGHIQHRTNLIFTDRRVIQHSVLVPAVGGGCDHSRLDFWVNDSLLNLTATERKKVTTFRATAKRFGSLSLKARHTSPFMMFMFRSLFHPRHRAPLGTLGVSALSKEEWKANQTFSSSVMTAAALDGAADTIIDTSANFEQELYSCIYKAFCCPRPPQTTITSTDDALYIEDYQQGSCVRYTTRVFVLLPWDEVEGVYWRNFDAVGLGCLMKAMTSCCKLGLFGMGVPCACCLPTCQEGSSHYHDAQYGYKGSTLAVCARGENTFCLGMVLPHQFTGVHDNGLVNSLVDAINHRCLLNDPSRLTASLSEKPDKASSPIAQFPVVTPYSSMSPTTVAGSIYSDDAMGPVSVSTHDKASSEESTPSASEPPHWSSYTNANCRRKPADQGFPLTKLADSSYLALAPGEQLLHSWKVETTALTAWQILLACLTLGLSLLMQQSCWQRRSYCSLFLTSERVLIKEEVFERRLWMVKRVMESQAAFRLSDLCYLNVIETGAKLCGCISALTEINLRFGRYPVVATQAVNGKTAWSAALAYASAKVYGQNDASAPHLFMGHILRTVQRPPGIVQYCTDMGMFAMYVVVSLWEQLMGQASVEEVVPVGGGDARTFTLRFKNKKASFEAREVVVALSRVAATKQVPLQPINAPATLSPPRYQLHPATKVTEVNTTSEYGADGGFVVLEKLWDLLPDELVYDVVPTNRRWKFTDKLLTVLTAGLYWLFYLRAKLQCKTSHMVTNRRMISHTLRVTAGAVRFSNLTMWVLAPNSSYTLCKITPKGCSRLLSDPRPRFQFVTSCFKFGAMGLSIRSEKFILNLLKVLTVSQPHSQQLAGAMRLTRQELSSISEMKNADFTHEFLGETVEVESALGATLPVTCAHTLACSVPTKFAIILTSHAVLVEVYDGHYRALTSLPWAQVTASFWSNFQAHSPVFCGYTKPAYFNSLHGYSGAQLRLSILSDRSFGVGIPLPGRYCEGVQPEHRVDDFLAALERRIQLTQQASVPTAGRLQLQLPSALAAHGASQV